VGNPKPKDTLCVPHSDVKCKVSKCSSDGHCPTEGPHFADVCGFFLPDSCVPRTADGIQATCNESTGVCTYQNGGTCQLTNGIVTCNNFPAGFPPSDVILCAGTFENPVANDKACCPGQVCICDPSTSGIPYACGGVETCWNSSEITNWNFIP
jgi:hypothetical protein